MNTWICIARQVRANKLCGGVKMSVKAMKFNLKIIALQASMGLWLLTVAMTLPGEQAHAQTLCTTNNWSGVVGEANLAAGEASATNRKYSGPCGLRVTLNGAETYVQDDNPLNETTFNTQFYFYMSDVVEDVVFFQAEDGSGAPVIQAYYDASVPGIFVDFSVPEGATETVPATGLETGWHSLEIQWATTGNPSVKLQRGSTATSQTWSNPLDMSAVTIEVAKLGALGVVPTAGSIDFDDYDSRREGVPERLPRGDANNDGVTNGDDQADVVNEFLLAESAAGTADCNEDGVVNGEDLSCIVNIFLGLE